MANEHNALTKVRVRPQTSVYGFTRQTHHIYSVHPPPVFVQDIIDPSRTDAVSDKGVAVAHWVPALALILTLALTLA